MVGLLSYLLWLANSDPPPCRDRFYAMKRRLLQRWGTPDGEELQEVVKPCWSCDGTGVGEFEGQPCHRCVAGVYDRFWCVLARWRLGARVFHTPGDRLSRKPDAPVAIRGLIEHADPGAAAVEAWLWLCLAFEPGFFWRAMTGSCRCAGRRWYPLANLQWVLFWARMYLARWRPRRCSRCRRPFVRPFEAGVWYVCRRCDRAGWRQADDEVPF